MAATPTVNSTAVSGSSAATPTATPAATLAATRAASDDLEDDKYGLEVLVPINDSVAPPQLPLRLPFWLSSRLSSGP
ncbi:hypothetical protein V496_01975 [Pseudogymnoascus sp. VKM F-4515 (FW-2607)]|nr:hypothetical protein V496_01975 [Pseudogymnoascus sp. VKM F-4515 (FW-2607)]